ncbi:MAG: hypothetical protein J5620_04580 [Alphaproteobacteria bacterium]|nr:hypothetical protein [Alphaproteobacteria bacterium]
MQKLLKTLERGIVCLSVVAFTSACFGDTSPARGAATQNRGRGTTAVSRMPSIPVLPVSAVGNMTTSKDDHTVKPTPDNPTPDNPTPDNPTPDTPVNPNPPTPECPDGGVANSDYTVETCMNDVLACVNGGALPNGINSLFNEDLRNSIVNGMGLCLTQVERCVTTVRRNCQYVYTSSSDVWLDFNARKVQPEYYAFVLRKTGLTPTQAENTCLLLDRNTYGLSFDAVSDADRVTSEYNQRVGAYNSALNDSLSKANPLGVEVNRTGIDGERGYYARWDAEKAECLLRVAAYNKDTLITNSWLFGAVGDDRTAEVWQSAGSTFTCNKDLFDFSLMPKTKTTAAVAIPGGTLVGAGIGALAGHGDRDFDCANETLRNQLLKKLQDNQKIGNLNQFIDSDLSSADKTMSQAQCNEIVHLYDLWQMGKEAITLCDSQSAKLTIIIDQITTTTVETCTKAGNTTNCDTVITQDKWLDWCKDHQDDCAGVQFADIENSQKNCRFVDLNHSRQYGTDVYCEGTGENCVNKETFQRDLDMLAKIFGSIDILEGQKSNRLKTTLIGAGTGAAVGGTATAITAFVERNNINCRVADGLARVSFGKSYTIDRLRDFYVKWALKLPQTLAPTAVVTNCDNWELTCAMFTDLDECAAAQFNYRPGNLSSTTLVQNPCKTSGSACITNLAVAQANGVCLVTPVNPDEPSDDDYPNVNNCTTWNDACQVYNNDPDKCATAKVIYTPASMLVSTACKYHTRINECRPSAVKVKKYMDPADCPFRID